MDYDEGDHPDSWSDGSGAFDEECMWDNEWESPWRARMSTSTGIPSNAWGARRNERVRADLAGSDDFHTRMNAVFDCLKSVNLDLITFLYGLSGSDPNMRGYEWQRTSNERTALLNHPDLYDVLRGFEDHCNRQHGANNPHNNPMLSYVLDSTRRNINKDQLALKPLMKLAAADVSGETLLTINWTQIVADVQDRAKFWFYVMLNAASTLKQRQNNVLKTPESLVVYQMCSDMYHRSPSHGKIVKLMTLYMRGCGLAAKAYDTLHHLGITFSQKWALKSVETLSKQAMMALNEDARRFLWIPNSDNINIAYRVQQQRINNSNHFDSGCLVTIYMLRDANIVRPSVSKYLRLRQHGQQNPLSWATLKQLDLESSQLLKPHLIHTIMSILIHSCPFDLKNYRYQNDDLLKGPAPIRSLTAVLGKGYRTCQYIMPVKHQEVASYEGNDKIAQWVFEKLKTCDHVMCDEANNRKCFAQNRLICWAGDQLTCARYRGLIKQRAGEFNSLERYDNLDPIFGWFHTVMTWAVSLYTDLGGTGNDHGLIHTCAILQRIHVHDPKVAGNWFSTFDEVLKHQCMGSIRTLWIQESGKSVEELRQLSPYTLKKLAVCIYEKFASNAAIANYEASQDALHEKLCDPVPGKMMLITRDLLRYTLFRSAMRLGDVGLMKAFLPELFFRFVGGGNSNYAVEMAEMIQRFEVEYTPEHRNFVTDYCWLINLRGAPDSYMPLDENEEHNIRDAKTIAKTGGVHVPWETMERMTPAMPVIRGIVNMFETQINPYRRGKSHTDPEVEQDIAKLTGCLIRDKVFQCIPGRTIRDDGEDPKKSVPTNHVRKGADKLRTSDWLANWAEGRDVDRETEELWESTPENSDMEGGIDESDEDEM